MDEPQNSLAADLHIDDTLLAKPPGELAEAIEEIPRVQGGAVLSQLPLDKAALVAEYLDPKTCAAILVELDATVAAPILEAMQRPEAGLVLAAMDPDDRVDILEQVADMPREQLLAELNTADEAETRQLASYPPDSAGGIMTTQVTSLYEYLTVDDAIQLLRRLSEELEQMFYVYVINRLGRLVGVLSMRDLILARPSRRLREIMIKGVRSVPATMDQEQVAKLMRDFGYLAMPVVDEREKLIGLITVDDVINVVQEEATEDMQRMFGAGAEERLTSRWDFSFRKRVFWLIVNLGTAFMAAAVVSRFQGVIAALPILAAYQTVVSGMGGNASAQAMAVAIRGLALGEVDRRLLKRVLMKEMLVGLLNGIVIGLATWAIIACTSEARYALPIGVTIFLALVVNHVNAGITGAAIPFAMKRMGFDPAQSSSIIATTFTDCGGFFATLGIAALMLHFGWIKT